MYHIFTVARKHPGKHCFPYAILLKRLVYRDINKNKLFFTVNFLNNRLTDFELQCLKFFFCIAVTRDRKKLHLFGHLLRNKIAEIIAKIARKLHEKFKNYMEF